MLKEIERYLKTETNLTVESNLNSLSIESPSENGIDCWITTEKNGFITGWNMCHKHFYEGVDDLPTAIHLFLVGLTRNSRMTAYAHGESFYRWTFEYKYDGKWIIIDDTRILFHEFWKKINKTTLQNNLLDYNDLVSKFDLKEIII